MDSTMSPLWTGIILLMHVLSVSCTGTLNCILSEVSGSGAGGFVQFDDHENGTLVSYVLSNVGGVEPRIVVHTRGAIFNNEGGEFATNGPVFEGNCSLCQMSVGYLNNGSALFPTDVGAFVDPHITLTGVNSILGRSVVVYGDQDMEAQCVIGRVDSEYDTVDVEEPENVYEAECVFQELGNDEIYGYVSFERIDLFPDLNTTTSEMEVQFFIIGTTTFTPSETLFAYIYQTGDITNDASLDGIFEGDCSYHNCTRNVGEIGDSYELWVDPSYVARAYYNDPYITMHGRNSIIGRGMRLVDENDDTLARCVIGVTKEGIPQERGFIVVPEEFRTVPQVIRAAAILHNTPGKSGEGYIQFILQENSPNVVVRYCFGGVKPGDRVWDIHVLGDISDPAGLNVGGSLFFSEEINNLRIGYEDRAICESAYELGLSAAQRLLTYNLIDDVQKNGFQSFSCHMGSQLTMVPVVPAPVPAPVPVPVPGPAPVFIDDYTIYEAMGIWLQFEGDGGDVTFSTCNPGTTFSANLVVWHGNCTHAICVSLGIGSEDACDTSTIPTINGEPYLMLIHGETDNPQSIGTFQLSYSSTELHGGLLGDGIFVTGRKDTPLCGEVLDSIRLSGPESVVGRAVVVHQGKNVDNLVLLQGVIGKTQLSATTLEQDVPLISTCGCTMEPTKNDPGFDLAGTIMFTLISEDIANDGQDILLGANMTIESLEITFSFTGLTPGNHSWAIHDFGWLLSGDNGASVGGIFEITPNVSGSTNYTVPAPVPSPSPEPVPANVFTWSLPGEFVVDNSGATSGSFNDTTFKFNGPDSIIGRAVVIKEVDEARSAFCVIGILDEVFGAPPAKDPGESEGLAPAVTLAPATPQVTLSPYSPEVTAYPTIEGAVTDSPTAVATNIPTAVPTADPTEMPTYVPTTAQPSPIQTAVPPTPYITAPPAPSTTDVPTAVPTVDPTAGPTSLPTPVPEEEEEEDEGESDKDEGETDEQDESDGGAFADDGGGGDDKTVEIVVPIVVILFVIIVCLLVWWWWRKNKRRRRYSGNVEMN